MDNYNYWLTNTDDKNELEQMSAEERTDAFYKELEFGTGGLRGVMGAGTNRINKYTVRRATQALANEIKSHGSDFADKGVVIAFDSRHNSAVFAENAACVLCANGIKTYLFDSLRPTPELSFAVRHLGCARGIVITASHNPKKYNGYKIYGEDGGQLPPKATEKIAEFIKTVDMFRDVKISDNTATIIGDELDRAYTDAVFAQSLDISIPSDFKVVYTPLHGAGNLPVRRILEKIGVKNVSVVPEQELPDGDFPTVKTPNPENRDVFDLAIGLAKENNADIIIGTDPDSDRIGVVINNGNGEYVALNGNETGALLTDFILSSSQSLPAMPHIVKTIVTTDMAEKIAESYNVNVDNVLTGFKFIGEKIKEYERSGKGYVFGLEESYGYLKGTYARDKDAVLAAMLIVQMAAYHKSNGFTLCDALSELYKKYGFYKQELISVVYEGISGHNKIDAIMENLRENGIASALSVKDYSEGIDGLPKSDVLKFFFKNGWAVVRPSGTEPKIKYYFEVRETDPDRAQQELDKLKGLLHFAQTA